MPSISFDDKGEIYQKKSLHCQKFPTKSVDGQGTTVLNLHSAFFDHRADVVQVIAEASHCQTQHLNLCLRPLRP